jgi:hypothetical protein
MKKKKKDAGLRSTKLSLRSIIHPDLKIWRKDIERAEKVARIINFDTHALLNVVVLSAKKDTLSPITLKWVINLQRAVLSQTPTSIEPQILEARKEWLKIRSGQPVPPLQTTEGMGNILWYNAEQILTSIQNLVSMTTYKRHCRLLNKWFKICVESPTKEEIAEFTLPQSQSRSLRVSGISAIKTFLQREAFGSTHPPACHVNCWDQIPPRIRPTCKQFVNELAAHVPNADYYKDNEHLWIPYLGYLSEKGVALGLKPFCVVPQCHHYGRRSIIIDTSTTFDIVKDQGLKSTLKSKGITYRKLYLGMNETFQGTEEQQKQLVEQQKEYDKKKDELKQKLGVKRLHHKTFENTIGEPPIKKARMSKENRFRLVWTTFLGKMSNTKFKQFHGMFRTDGVSASLVMQRQPKRFIDDDVEKTERNQKMAERAQGRNVVIGLDPGIRDIFTTARHDDCKEFKNTTVTHLKNTKYQHLRGTAQYKYGMKCIKDKHPEIREIESNLPTTKTHDLGVFITGITERYKVVEQLWNFYGSVKMANMKFSLYEKGQKGEKEIIDRLYGENKVESTIVAFGAANFSGQGIKGHSPSVKGRGLKKMIDRVYGSRACVIDVNENNTSQMCSGVREDGTTCGERLSSKGLLHAVRRCQSVECSARLWNRDVNAARNILQRYVTSAGVDVSLLPLIPMQASRTLHTANPPIYLGVVSAIKR